MKKFQYRNLNTFVMGSPINTSSAFTDHQSNLDISKILNDLVFLSVRYSSKDYDKIPKSFEPQINGGVWENWLTSPLNQGDCGSCWSYATSSTLADRINILSRTRVVEGLSPLLPIVCNDITQTILDKHHTETVTNPFRLNKITQEKLGCFGNSLISAALNLQFLGTSRSSCFPYDINNLARFKMKELNWGLGRVNQDDIYTPTRFSSFSKESNQGASCAFYNPYQGKPFLFCTDTIRLYETVYYGTPVQTFSILCLYTIDHWEQTQNICYEIYRWGPVSTSFLVYPDFYEFDPLKDGVYIHDDTSKELPIGGHAVEIVGWGIFESKPFWWIKNSWGSQYGYKGYFRFFRGSNQCQIEKNVLAFLPDLFIDYSDIDKIQQMRESFWSLGIFHISKPIEPIINLVFKIFQSTRPNYKKIYLDGVRKAFQNYNIFFYGELMYQTFLAFDSPSPTGYHVFNYLIMPGFDYSGGRFRNDGSMIELPLYPGFIAGLNQPYLFIKLKPPIPPKPIPPENDKILMIVFLVLVCIFIIIVFFSWWTIRNPLTTKTLNTRI